MIKILVVDDDPVFLQGCCERLLTMRWGVDVASTAEQARLKLRTEVFDVLLLDLMLPPTFRTEGLETLRFAQEHYPTVHVLMMTHKDSGTIEIVADAMRSGARYFLDKQSPVVYEKMIELIHDVLSEARNSVFLSHGHNEALWRRLRDFLVSRMKLSAIVLQELPSQGLTVVEKLERASERCRFAIILMTRDDEQRSGGTRARQNVVHEVGFFQGRYGRQNVVLLAEVGVEMFSNISGIITLDFDPDHFEEVFEPLRREIEVAFR
jgi:DNA-binding NtrC family response regulator